MEQKVLCRQAIRERLSRLNDNDRRVESNVIMRNLRETLDKKRIIAGFIPYRDEPQILPLLQSVLNDGKVLCIPQVQHQRLVMRQVMNLAIDRNPLTGIPDPTEGEAMREEDIEVVIVPGRAFMKSGERMGRGNGGYDYWIHAQRKRNPATLFIGICFECQLLTALPMESHDEHVDRVITSR